ncbi:hypothetical protein HDK77DRAFT_514891 [Phyllosticta capitalensis]
MSTDATDMSNPFRCRLCDQQYTGDNDLVAHFIQVHPNEKPYKCPRCNKSCAEAVRTLTRHYDYNEKCLALGEDSATNNAAAPAAAPAPAPAVAPSATPSAAVAATATTTPAPPLDTKSDTDEDEVADDQKSGNAKVDEDKEEEGYEEGDFEKKEQAKTLLEIEEEDILELIEKLKARLATIRLQRKALE